MPFHASRSILSSCKPRFFLKGSSVDGRPTPREGGIKPGGGALMVEGAIRECRIWARDDRIVS